MPRTAEIIAVGSELLTGGVTNTNARFLSELLTAAGVDVLYHTAVGDDEGRLEAAVTAARQRAELLVFTGGLGPTYDDMTKTAVCAALVAMLAATGAIAWLTDQTQEVKNTFTVGNIDIDLAETADDFKMVPGNDIAKDPVVTVKAGSEDCWLFVKIDESANLADFIAYEVADGWTALEGEDGVYYREVAAAEEDVAFSVLAGDTVHVLDTVTKEQMDALTQETYPTLAFTAYAVQKANLADAAAAWAAAQGA